MKWTDDSLGKKVLQCLNETSMRLGGDLNAEKFGVSLEDCLLVRLANEDDGGEKGRDEEQNRPLGPSPAFPINNKSPDQRATRSESTECD